MTIRGATVADVAPRPGRGDMTSTSHPLLSWQQAIEIAFRLADENGWRYRVWRDTLGGWNVARAGRRPSRAS